MLCPLKLEPKKKLEDIWKLCDDLINKRQSKVKTLVAKGKLRQRQQQGYGREAQTGKSMKLVKSKNKNFGCYI